MCVCVDMHVWNFYINMVSDVYVGMHIHLDTYVCSLVLCLLMFILLCNRLSCLLPVASTFRCNLKAAASAADLQHSRNLIQIHDFLKIWIFRDTLDRFDLVRIEFSSKLP